MVPALSGAFQHFPAFHSLRVDFPFYRWVSSPSPVVKRPRRACADRLVNSPQPGPSHPVFRPPPQSPLQENSPQSVISKPWEDKFDFLKLLSMDSKYQNLLWQVNHMFITNVSLHSLFLRNLLNCIPAECYIHQTEHLPSSLGRLDMGLHMASQMVSLRR